MYRTVRTQPVVFSTVDPRALFYGNNVLWKTIDGGINWKQISPDLTREKWDVPKSVGTYASRVQRRERGAIGAQVIYTIGPSYVDINRIWIGTDDGVIATTADGGLHWTNVTPPQLTVVHEGVHHRSGPLRSADGLRGSEHAAARRHEPAHLPHA